MYRPYAYFTFVVCLFRGFRTVFAFRLIESGGAGGTAHLCITRVKGLEPTTFSLDPASL